MNLTHIPFETVIQIYKEVNHKSDFEELGNKYNVQKKDVGYIFRLKIQDTSLRSGTVSIGCKNEQYNN